MKRSGNLFAKALAPRLISKALKAFDNAMLIVVAAAWSAALLMLLFAAYTVNNAVKERRELLAAEASEPVVPVVNGKAPDISEMQPIVGRLQKRFSEISFVLGNDRSLTVSSGDGAKFRLWLTVLSYIDTVSPQYRWSMREFCVGMKCGSNTPMRAVLTAEKITFSVPAAK